MLKLKLEVKNGYNNGMGTIADLNALGFNELDGKTVETACKWNCT